MINSTSRRRSTKEKNRKWNLKTRDITSCLSISTLIIFLFTSAFSFGMEIRILIYIFFVHQNTKHVAEPRIETKGYPNEKDLLYEI
jgi:hypothetical protein